MILGNLESVDGYEWLQLDQLSSDSDSVGDETIYLSVVSYWLDTHEIYHFK